MATVTLQLNPRPSSDWRRSWFRPPQSKFVDHLPGVSQICSDGRPVLAPAQRTIEDVEFWVWSLPPPSTLPREVRERRCRRHALRPRQNQTDCESSIAPRCQKKKSPQQTSFMRARSPRRTPSDRQPLIRQCHVTHPTVLHAHSRFCPRPGQAFLRSTHACLLTGHETLAHQTWERCRRLPSCQQCPSRPSWRDEPILGQTLRSVPLRPRYRTCVAAYTPQSCALADVRCGHGRPREDRGVVDRLT